MIFKETKKVSKTYKILSLKIWQSDFKSEQIHAHTSETSPGDSSSKCSLREFIRTLPKEKEKGMKNLHSFILNLNEKLGNLANQWSLLAE